MTGHIDWSLGPSDQALINVKVAYKNKHNQSILVFLLKNNHNFSIKKLYKATGKANVNTRAKQFSNDQYNFPGAGHYSKRNHAANVPSQTKNLDSISTDQKIGNYLVNLK